MGILSRPFYAIREREVHSLYFLCSTLYTLYNGTTIAPGSISSFVSHAFFASLPSRADISVTEEEEEELLLFTARLGIEKGKSMSLSLILSLQRQGSEGRVEKRGGAVSGV